MDKRTCNAGIAPLICVIPPGLIGAGLKSDKVEFSINFENSYLSKLNWNTTLRKVKKTDGLPNYSL